MTEPLTNRLDDNPFLIFLHLHKCAGMTFQRELLRVLGKPLILRAYEHFFSKAPVGLAQKMQQMTMADRYFSGHISYGAHQYLPTPSTYITFLREPAERLISLYNYARATPGAYYHPKANRFSISEFLLTGKGALEVDNGMTRFIAGGDDRLFVDARPFGTVDESLFLQARENLEKRFSFIGITEQYDLSYLVFCKLLNILPKPYLTLNQAKKPSWRSDLSAGEIEAIRSQNHWDYKLYEYGLNWLRERSAELIPDADAEVARFRDRKQSYNQRWGKVQVRLEVLKEKFKGISS
jgi:hypothetical protein